MKALDKLQEYINTHIVKGKGEKMIICSPNQLIKLFNSIISEGISDEEIREYFKKWDEGDEYSVKAAIRWANGQLAKRQLK